MTYRAPVRDLAFLLEHVAGLPALRATHRFAEATPESVAAVLEGAARLAEGVLAPLNRVGDRQPARLEAGAVRMPPGFAGAWREIGAGGWLGLSAPPEHGGQGLPFALATAVNEIVSGACLAMNVGTLLTQGQIEALAAHADAGLKALALPRLVAGEWSGTMNLTEPQAGSDLGRIATRAEPDGAGGFRVTGQKIYISWGDHDLAGNVSHLVLARLPGAPEGSRGLSLFWVPKRLPDGDGRAGAANAVRVLGLERKMGLHGAPTATMAYEGAAARLVGAPQGGLAAMFTMMNSARLGVGMQGIGVAEAAVQRALAHARERVQGGGAIVGHPDVRRMLATMRADVVAARGIALLCAVAADMAAATGDPAWAARAGLLTPIAKVAGTETGIRTASEAIQVMGGLGYIEDAGAAQLLRDVRVTAIYEGTNGIQALDLAGRKLADGGEAAFDLIDEVQATAEAARHALPGPAGEVWAAAEALREGTEAFLRLGTADRGAGALPFLRAFARVLGAHVHLSAARAEGGAGPRRALARVAVARLLPEHAAHLAEARAGGADLTALAPADLAA